MELYDRQSGGKNLLIWLFIGLCLIAVSVTGAFFDTSGGEGYGALSLIPPVATILLAFITKQTVVSIFTGVFLGSTIIHAGNPLDGLMTTFTGYVIPQMADSWNAGMLVLIVLIGGFMYLLNACGGAEAFGRWAQKKANTRRKTQLMAWMAPFFILYDQGCLLVGIIMRPVTDRMKISRVKLAYIVDSMGVPVVSMSPINDYGVYLVGLIAAELAAHGLADNPYSIYFGMFQFNLYAIGTIIAVLLVILMDLDIGPMGNAEKHAIETGETYFETDRLIATPPETEFAEGQKFPIRHFLIPVGTLMVSVLGSIFYTGEAWNNGIIGSFGNCDIQLSIIISFFMASVAAILVGYFSKLTNFNELLEQWIAGAASMIQVLLILVCAWSISAVTKDMGIGNYFTGLMDNLVSPALIPAIMFLFGVIISFATGSSWGVWALGIPIAVPMAGTFGISLPLIIGAVVSGGLFGDNCSPISDTTIQSSTSSCCDHIQHVRTQLPYAVIVGGSSFIGYVVAGFVSTSMAIPVTLLISIAILYVLKQRTLRHL